MAEFSDATIDHFEALGRRKISSNMNLRVVRYSPTITSDIITLPADCIDIISVTWKGLPLGIYLSRDYMQQGLPFYNATSVPLSYVFDKLVAIKTIKLYPYPNQLLASGNVDSQIPFCCVITYRALCTDVNPAPAWMERRILKYFIASSCYLIEGRTQNLKVATFFQKRFNEVLDHFQKVLIKLYLYPRSLVVQGRTLPGVGWKRKNLPVLPARYGFSAEDSITNR